MIQSRNKKGSNTKGATTRIFFSGCILLMKSPIEIVSAVFYDKDYCPRKLLSGLPVHDLVVKCTTEKL